MSTNDNVRETFDKLVTGKARRITDPGPLAVGDVPDNMMVDETDVSVLGAEDIEVVKHTTVPLDKRTAAWLVNCSEVPGERLIRDTQVDLLATAMTRGTLRPELVNLGVCECVADASIYRVNGNHSARARLGLNDDDYAPLVNLHIYRSKTLAGVRALYAQFDRGAPRTRSNIVESYLATIPPFDGYGRMLRGKLAAGLAFSTCPSSHARVRMDADVIATMMSGPALKACVHVADLLRAVSPKESRHISRSGTIAAMMATYAVGVNKSTEFWAAVRDGTGIASTNDPRLKLRNELISKAVGSANNLRKIDVTLSSEQVYRFSIAAWTLWREGRPMTRMQASTSKDRPVPK